MQFGQSMGEVYASEDCSKQERAVSAPATVTMLANRVAAMSLTYVRG